jgi:hypothetical protein
MDAIAALIWGLGHGKFERFIPMEITESSDASERKIVDAARGKVAPVIEFCPPKMAMVAGFCRSRICEVVRVFGMRKGKAQAVMPMVAVHLFIPIPGLKVEKIALYAIPRSGCDGKTGAVSGFIIKIVNEIFGIDDSMVGAFAGILGLMRILHYGGIMLVGTLHIEKIAIDVETLLSSTRQSQDCRPNAK